MCSSTTLQRTYAHRSIASNALHLPSKRWTDVFPSFVKDSGGINPILPSTSLQKSFQTSENLFQRSKLISKLFPSVIELIEVMVLVGIVRVL